MSWAWREHRLSFGYPMSLDGHVFRGEDLVRWLSDIKFDDPNQLESILAMRAAASSPSPEWPVMLASFTNSVVTNFPINMVQTRFPGNRVGGNKDSGPLEMTLRFLDNERIVRPEFAPATVSSTHIPIIPQWEKIV